MKIQYLAIIFIIIIMPIVIVYSEYINNQITTIKTEGIYDARLLDSTYDAIKAYQLNTMSNVFSEKAEHKKSDIEASAKTFLNSISTSFQYTGYKSDIINEYIPAIVYTMYDGYYIYQPLVNTLTNVNVEVDDEYSDESTLHGLKPYVYYSCRYKPKGTSDDFTIIYSLDNYISIEGYIGGKYVFKKGYLYQTDNNENNEILTYKDNKIYYKGITITRDDEEALSEYLGKEDKYYYVKIDGQKFYYKGNATNGNIANVAENDYIFNISETGSIYKVCEYNDKVENNKENFKQYYNAIFHNNKGYQYYVDAFEFSESVKSLIGNLSVEDAVDENGNYYNQETNPFNNALNFKIFEGSLENTNSNFNKHRADVIRKVIRTNLSTSISGFKKYCNLDEDIEFIMPKISETDWEQIENNICIITFLQGMQIGGKVYNSYSVVPNNLNKEYVDENDIYMLTTEDKYTKSNDANLSNGKKHIKSKNTLGYYPGVLKTNFVRRKYIKEKEIVNQDVENVGYYYPLTEMASYSGIVGSTSVNTLLYTDMYDYMSKSNTDISGITNDEKEKYIKSYYIALGRERTGVYNVNNGLGDEDQKLSQKYPNGWYFQTNISLAEIVFTPNELHYASGQSVYEPESISLKIGDKILTENVDYKIIGFNNNTSAGEGEIIIEGKGIYAGTQVIGKFPILPIEPNDGVSIDVTPNQFVYDGGDKIPDVTLAYNNKSIECDAFIEPDGNIDAGMVKVLVTSKDKNYNINKEVFFNIKPKDFSNLQAANMEANLDTTQYNYDGTEHCPSITIVDNGSKKQDKTLVVNKDYTLSYSNNKYVGTASAVVKGVGNYTGSFTKTFTINGIPTNDPSFTVNVNPSNFTFDGSEKIPTVTVLYNGRALTKDVDYELILPTDRISASASPKVIKIKGKKEFVGTNKEAYYYIEPAGKKFDITINESSGYFIYDGTAKTPRVTVKVDNEVVNASNYTVSYANNVKIGQGTITVTAKEGSNYQGMVRTKTFSIFAKAIEGSDVSKTINTSSFVYNGAEHKPTPTLTYKGKTLVRNVDYTVEYANNINAGTGKVKIKGMSNYTGSYEIPFTINPKTITSGMVTLQKTSAEYSTAEIDAGVVVKDGTKTLVKGTDYTLSYDNNLNVGTGKVIIKGKNNYTGQVEKTFTIKTVDLNSLEIEVLDSEYDSTPQKPNCTIKKGSIVYRLGLDYSVSYSNNINAGTGTVKITGLGNLTGTVTKTFTISRKSLTDTKSIAITLSKDKYTYNGESQKPTVTIIHKLVKDGDGGAGGPEPEPITLTSNDYSVTFPTDTTSQGTKTITITGKGNYTGTVKKTYSINKKSISSCTITLSGTSFYYTGSAITPGVTVKDGTKTLTKNTDYTIEYSNNISPSGENLPAFVYIEGKGNYSGSETKAFTITKKDISDLTITLSGTSFDYTGSAITPGVTVKDGNTTLTKDTHYTVTYSDNVNVTTQAKVTITAKNDSIYKGTVVKNFTINAISVEKSVSGTLGRIGFKGDNGVDRWSNAYASGTLTWNGTRVTGTIYGYAKKRVEGYNNYSAQGTVKDGAKINVTGATAISIGYIDTYTSDTSYIGSTDVNTTEKTIEVWLTGGSYTTSEYTLKAEF